jgi:hypothetical protein
MRPLLRFLVFLTPLGVCILAQQPRPLPTAQEIQIRRQNCTIARQQVEVHNRLGDVCALDERTVDDLTNEYKQVTLEVCQEESAFDKDGYALTLHKQYVRAVRRNECRKQEPPDIAEDDLSQISQIR